MNGSKPPKSLGILAGLAAMGDGIDKEIFDEVIKNSDFFKTGSELQMTKEEDEALAKEASFSFDLFKSYCIQTESPVNMEDTFRIGFAQGGKWQWLQNLKKKDVTKSGHYELVRKEVLKQLNNNYDQEILINARLLATVQRLNAKLRDIQETFNHENMSVNGWHQNGEAEPMSKFFNENDWEPEDEKLEKVF